MPLADGVARRCARLVREQQATRRVPGIAAAVRRGDDVWSTAVGLADVDADAPVTDDAQFRIGSITKTFTAVLVLQLRDAGHIHLDDEIADYLPVPARRGITVRRLLAHLAGVPREPANDTWASVELPTDVESLPVLDEGRAPLAAGVAFHYSNVAFGLLGRLVEKLAGMPYAEVLATRVLDPLHLRRTTLTPIPPHAHGYLVDPYADSVAPEPPVDLRALAPAGQLWSTATDLLRWGAFLARPDPTVLAPSTLEEMTQPVVMADLQHWSLAWGLGLMLHRRDDLTFIGHDGGMPGFIASLVVQCEANVAATVLMNTSARADPRGLALDLATAALGDDGPDRVGTGGDAWRPGPGVPESLVGLLGRWWSEGTEYVFVWRDGELQARAADSAADDPPAVFDVVDADTLRVRSGRERGELLQIVRDSGGAPSRLLWAGSPMDRRAVPTGAQP